MLHRFSLQLRAERAVLGERRPHHLIVCFSRLRFAYLQIARDEWQRRAAIVFYMQKDLVTCADKALHQYRLGLQSRVADQNAALELDQFLLGK